MVNYGSEAFWINHEELIALDRLARTVRRKRKLLHN
jgi:hypothetical protein